MVDHLSIQLYPIQFRIYFTTTPKWKAVDVIQGTSGVRQSRQSWCTVGCDCWNKLLWQCIKYLMSHSPNQEYVDSYRLFIFWLCASAHLILNPILDLLIQSNIKITLSLPNQDANCNGFRNRWTFFPLFIIKQGNNPKYKTRLSKGLTGQDDHLIPGWLYCILGVEDQIKGR